MAYTVWPLPSDSPGKLEFCGLTSIPLTEVYYFRELNCNNVDLDWDVDRVVDNLRTISVIIYQELNTDIRGDPN